MTRPNGPQPNTSGSLGPTSLQPKRLLDRFSRLGRAGGRVRQTDQATTLIIGRILRCA